MRSVVKRWLAVGAVVGPFGLAAGCGHLARARVEADADGGPAAECAPGSDCHTHTKVEHHPTLHALGSDLDHLERHIDWFGSATAKAPDVWGQARLTQYREQFEKLMTPGNTLEFQAGLQGALARSDQAFFAQATALAIAAQPKPPLIGTNAGAKAAAAPALVPSEQTVQVVVKDQPTDTTSTERTTATTSVPPPAAPAAAPAAPPTAADPATLVSTPDAAVIRDASLAAGRVGFGSIGADKIGIEPTLFVAQKKRYLDFLNQLRRENEGDDTADSPGYALHLIRVPVSILPGKRTDEGHGAEVTMTLTPVLGDELLPTTFRNLVTNDLVKNLAFPVTKFLDEDRGRAAEDRVLTNEYREGVRYEVFQYLFTKGLVRLEPPPGVAIGPDKQQTVNQQAQEVQRKTTRGRLSTPGSTDPIRVIQAGIKQKLSVPRLSFTNAGQDREPFPTSQLTEVYGPLFTFEIGFAAQQALARETAVNNYAHLPSVQSFLREETRAAYQFLSAPANRHLWGLFCTPELVALVRSQQWEALEDKRREFRNQVEVLTGSQPLRLVFLKDEAGAYKKQGDKYFVETNPVRDTRQMQVTAALAWGVLVDSALLTDRLVRDMKEASAARGKPGALCPDWLPYYLPCPPAEARAAFNSYAALRWPVRVFALDPYTQDQNVADALSTRRETQLALSIAFTNGFIGANSLTRYTRRLEAEYETVALNRTQVGFSHGENVFGWRFYPRFQSPDTESNLKTLVRDQLIGGPGRDALLRQRRLEPGPRECVAVVMMPTFVPHATLDVNTNWFGLANPKHKVLDHTQALHLSRKVQAIKTHGPEAAGDANCYRDGEFPRLLRRVDQLEARLPTQTLGVPLPAANTLGGFEMFSNGTTDLAPELYGWYGAPGVTGKGTTTLFLVGDHFSPLRTNVVIGNQPADKTLLSRQVMKVTVTGPLLTVTDPATRKVYAQAHVATPYGVTRELLIPVADAAPPADTAEGYKLAEDAVTIDYDLVPSKKYAGAHRFDKVTRATPSRVTLGWDDASGSVPRELEVLFVFERDGKPVPVSAVRAVKVVEKDGEFVIPEEDLKRVAGELIRAVQTDDLRPGANPFDAPFVTKAVKVTPVAAGVHAVQPRDAKNQLTLTFAGRYVAPADPAGPASPFGPPRPRVDPDPLGKPVSPPVPEPGGVVPVPPR